jgi:hypothetical protein
MPNMMPHKPISAAKPMPAGARCGGKYDDGGFSGGNIGSPAAAPVPRSEYTHGDQLAGSCDVVGTGSGWRTGGFATTRETPANVRGSSRRKQAFFLCDRRSYDRSMAGLGASRAPRYFASNFDRSNRLTGWRVRIEAVVSRRCRARTRSGTARVDWYFNAVPGRIGGDHPQSRNQVN